MSIDGNRLLRERAARGDSMHDEERAQDVACDACDACHREATCGAAIQCHECGGLFCSSRCLADFHGHADEYAVNALRALERAAEEKRTLELLRVPALMAHLAQMVAIVEGKLMSKPELAAVDSAHAALGHRWNGKAWVRADGTPLTEEDIRW